MTYSINGRFQINVQISRGLNLHRYFSYPWLELQHRGTKKRKGEKKKCVERCGLNKLLSGHAKKAKDVRGFLKPRSIYSFCHFLWVV